MPAIITHHVFGEDASSLLPDGLFESQEDLIAFLLGNQGPDPFWIRFSCLPKTAFACRNLASRMHTEKACEALLALRDGVEHLSAEDRSTGRAFVLGMAAHYLLDSICHPLIFSLQSELVSQDADLGDAGAEVHALIESDIDSWILWQKRQKTIVEYPCSGALATTERTNRIGGALLSQMAWEVFGINLGAAEYGRALVDYRHAYRLIDPPSERVAAALVRVERLFRPHSRIQAQAHHVLTHDECKLANLEHHLWRDPATNEASRASIADLFHDALLAWPMFSRRLVEGDRPRLEQMIAGVNYYGVPTHS